MSETDKKNLLDDIPLVAGKIVDQPDFVNLPLELAGAEFRHVGQQQQQPSRAIQRLGFYPPRTQGNRMIVAVFREEPLDSTISELCGGLLFHGLRLRYIGYGRRAI